MRRVFFLPALLFIWFIPVNATFAVPILNLVNTTTSSPVVPGQNVSFVITASNTGSTTTDLFVLNARIPSHTTVPQSQVNGAICSSGFFPCQPGEILSWTNLRLSSGTSLTRQFSARVNNTLPPPDGTIITSTASTSLGLAVDALATVRSGTGLNLVLDSIPNIVTMGGGYQYKLTYSNTGSVVDANLVFSLPSNVNIVSASDGGVVAGGAVTWNLANIPAGSSGSRYIQAHVPLSIVNGTLVLSGAQLLDNTGVQQLATANSTTSVGDVTPLELTVSALPDPVAAGQNVSFVITASDTGSTTTNLFVLNARVPSHTTVPQSQVNGAICSSGVFPCQPGEILSWTNLRLSLGASLTRQFSALVDSVSPPANGTLLGTVINTSLNGGAGVTGEAVVGIDSDNDGVSDANDNCTLIPNSNQRDTDADGFGNICDADFDNNLAVNFADLGFMKSVFFTTNADADLNGDGAVNFADLGLMKSMFFKAPGPSGLAP